MQPEQTNHCRQLWSWQNNRYRYPVTSSCCQSVLAFAVTAGNFLRAMLFTILLSVLLHSNVNLEIDGVWYAIVSGAVASGLGYAIWYSVLPTLKVATAATVQLSVPVIAALGSIIFLGESLTVRFVFASLAILGGIALVILCNPQRNSAAPSRSA